MMLFIILITGFTLVSSRHQPFYRKDYKFFEEFDAFYKLHWSSNGVSWDTAFMTCDDEGAQLFYPKLEDEWQVVKNLSASLDPAPNTTDVIVGIHDEISRGEFITVDGQVTPSPILDGKVPEGQYCVILDSETGLYHTAPCMVDPWTWRMFICKKVDERPCPTIDMGYKYNKSTKKCYKVNLRSRTWSEAMYTCLMEGGLLAVIENSGEAQIVYDIISAMPGRDDSTQEFFAGFRRIFPQSDFYTVKGTKLSDSYNLWYTNDEKKQYNNNCGIVYNYNNGLYVRSHDCEQPLPFICEMDAKKP